MNISKKNRPPLAICALAALIFFIKITHSMPTGMTRSFCDPDSEGNSIQGARYFLKTGLSKTAGLPYYPGIVFETPVKKVNETFIYTHYFPGPDYILTAMIGVLGDRPSTITAARWIPTLILFASILLFAFCCERFVFNGWVWGKIYVLLPLLFAPAIFQWAYNLHGHSYSSSLILLGLCLGMAATEWFKKYRTLILGTAFLLGFISQYMLLTGAIVVFFAPVAGFLIGLKKGKMADGFALALATGLGLTAGFSVHFLQVASFLESWSLAWQDQFGTAFLRAEDRGPPDRIQLIGRYSQYVAGAFRISALNMIVLGVFMAWLYDAPAQRRLRLAGAVVGSGVASYVWIVGMKVHSAVHTHLNFRIFLLLFAVWLAVGVGLLAQRAVRHGAKLGASRLE